MRGRFRFPRGNHRPCCGGRCLVAVTEPGESAVGMSIAFFVVPTVTFIATKPKHESVLLSLLVAALAAACFVTLAVACLTEPGILPAAPNADGRGQRVTHVLIRGERVPLAARRAKMCRQTRNVVERFDHFCPWVGNSVGRRNYRAFVAFMCCVSALSVTVLFATAGRIWGDWPPATAWGGLLAGLCVYALTALAAVGSLLSYHARLIAVAQTTNEDLRCVYASRADNPHDRGCWRNCGAFCCAGTPPSLVFDPEDRGEDSARLMSVELTPRGDRSPSRLLRGRVLEDGSVEVDDPNVTIV